MTEDQPLEKPHTYSLAVLQALQTRPMYQGTVDEAKIAKRRKANRVAKATRKRNRRG